MKAPYSSNQICDCLMHWYVIWVNDFSINYLSSWAIKKNINLITCNEVIFRTNENVTFESFIYNIRIFNLIPNFVSYYFPLDILMLVFERDSILTAAVAVDISISGVHLFLTLLHQIEVTRICTRCLGEVTSYQPCVWIAWWPGMTLSAKYASK